MVAGLSKDVYSRFLCFEVAYPDTFLEAIHFCLNSYHQVLFYLMIKTHYCNLQSTFTVAFLDFTILSHWFMTTQ